MDPIEHTEITAGLWHLRPPREAEAGDLLALAEDPDTVRWSPPLPSTEEGAAAWVRTQAEWDGRVTFSILESSTERWAGHVTVTGLEGPEPVVLCRVAPWARGRGAATTAVRCLSGWVTAILGTPRLTLVHAPADLAACHVATKTGYPLTSTTPTTHLHARTP
ncbi:GNAT family N-acetyltransferase [Actinocorallia herbida]|uniref:GNAT family N-acetyltransferase n=1 Tax=Actinocorallia herbida TaxID=58109 RepID=UPI001476E5FE|nr:GNAT family N-acetyltransferase [Actinocorallia herbida]